MSYPAIAVMNVAERKARLLRDGANYRSAIIDAKAGVVASYAAGPWQQLAMVTLVGWVGGRVRQLAAQPGGGVRSVAPLALSAWTLLRQRRWLRQGVLLGLSGVLLWMVVNNGPRFGREAD
ncbi:hypothetical protein QWZ03_01660 [Chitinimonas viridis]|uniref:Uncharacterized protein n=1 Tax=Chitinimonas viridis TaxID=664880 RepID=A0ABT8B1D3_9NEIS|nr:hypothetical protein [Chitinimonas viridis]MDN3575476.1 hypothetical protein [Chitinimonas viridis]